MVITIPKGNFVVKAYRGKRALKEIQKAFDKIQKPGDVIYDFGYEGGFDKVLGKKWWEKARKVKWTKTKFKGIFSWHKLAHKPTQKRANVRYVNTGKGNIEVVIWKDTVRIFLLAKKNPAVILIKNNEIAQGFKNYWKFLWQKGKEGPTLK